MPKQKGIIILQGFLNGTSYFPLNGAYYSRVPTVHSKKRIQTDPAFAKVRANNQEFGMASKWSKALRKGILETTKEFQDTTISGRLTGVCYNIIQEGAGPKGRREANLANNPQALIGFKLKNKQALDSIYTVNPMVTSNKNRRVITLSIPKSNEIHLYQTPKTATHFQLIAALSVVSNYKCRPDQKAYRPIAPKHNGLGTSQKTEPLACKTEHTNLQIQLETPVKTVVSPNASLVVWFGIQYLKLNDSQAYTFKNSQVMQCVAIL